MYGFATCPNDNEHCAYGEVADENQLMKIGLIGFGFMGGVHLAAIERIPGATVTAVASRTRPLPDAPPRGNLEHVESSRIPADTPVVFRLAQSSRFRH